MNEENINIKLSSNINNADKKPGITPESNASIRQELKHGWPIILSGLLGTAVGVINVAYVLAITIPPISEEFRWQRSDVAIAFSTYTVAVFLSTPWWGRLYDRFSAKQIGPAAVLLLAATELMITQVGGSIWSLYIAFFAIGILGSGTAYLAYSRAVTSWFDRGRGLALAMTMVGPSISAAALPVLLTPLIQTYGWRSAYVALGLLSLTALPLMLFVVREKPGVAARQGAGDTAPPPGLPLRAALQTRPFWCLAGGVGLSALGVAGLHLHMMPMMLDLGATATRAAQALALLGIGVLCGRLLTGVLLDRIFAPAVAAAFMLAPPIGVLLFEIEGVGAAYLLAFGVGVAFGAESDILAFLTSRYFGLRSYSEIFGWLYGIYALAAAASPLLLAAVYHLTGDYSACRIIAALLCLGGAVCYASGGRYRRYE